MLRAVVVERVRIRLACLVLQDLVEPGLKMGRVSVDVRFERFVFPSCHVHYLIRWYGPRRPGAVQGSATVGAGLHVH